MVKKYNLTLGTNPIPARLVGQTICETLGATVEFRNIGMIPNAPHKSEISS